MGKSIYSCIIEGDPICDMAPKAQRLLFESRDRLKDLAFLLGEIYAHEGEQETDLGYLMGQVDACLKILSTHTESHR